MSDGVGQKSRKTRQDNGERKHKTHKRKTTDNNEHEHEKERESRSKRKKEEARGVTVVDDNAGDDEYWVEKSVDNYGDSVSGLYEQHTCLAWNDEKIPTAESLKLTSHVTEPPNGAKLPPDRPTESKLKRDDWMLGPPTTPASLEPSSSRRPMQSGDDSIMEDYEGPSNNSRALEREADFFSGMGVERKRKDVEKLAEAEISSRELNPFMRRDAGLDGPVSNASHSQTDETPSKPKPKQVPGGPGSQWRMVKLRRTYELAEEEGRRVEDVAMERYGGIEEFEESIEERRVLDEREHANSGRGGGSGVRRHEPERQGGGEIRYMFSETPHSGPPSRSGSFRRPNTGSAPSTPGLQPNNLPMSTSHDGLRRKDLDRLRSSTTTPQPQARTPIPSVFTPPPANRASSSSSSTGAPLSTSELNKLQARALRAKLMGGGDAQQLQKEYEEALERSQSQGGRGGGEDKRVEVLPTLDGMGRLYDVGAGMDGGSKTKEEEHDEERRQKSGNRRKKEEKFETRDPKTGDLLRYNADDDTQSLGELLRQEKFSAGSADQKDLDASLARAIMSDGKFEDNLDYADDNAERLARRKMKSETVKRMFAVNDYKRTQKALSTCVHCFGDDDSPPKAGVIAMATRCYLALTTNEELVDGHVCIVPIQHCLTTLEGDDDLWEEIRNFMKCLMKMYAEEDKGVVFYETVLNLRSQRHTFIECVPVPWEFFDLLPQYFKESILSSESEWSTHRKVIDFAKRPGGFRRAMVPNLPYFMVMFDYKGEKGLGHVIEGGGGGGMGAEDDFDGKGDGNGEDEGKGGDFPRWFAAEIIGNVLEVEPRRWRRQRRIELGMNRSRTREFRLRFDKFDWTSALGQ